MEYRHEGIIIKKTDISEADRIYLIYTKESGKIKLIGKGVRKPNAKLAGSLENLNYSEIFFSKSKGMGKITGVIVENFFHKIREDIGTLEKVLSAIDFFEKMVPEQEKDEKIFFNLLKFLEESDRLSGKKEFKKVLAIKIGFLLKLVDFLGYGINPFRCSHCQEKLKPGNNFFSFSEGGIICKECSKSSNNKDEISDSAIKIIRIFIKNDLEKLEKIKVPDEELENLESIIARALAWHSS